MKSGPRIVMIIVMTSDASFELITFCIGFNAFQLIVLIIYNLSPKLIKGRFN